MTPLATNPEPTAQEVFDAVVHHSRQMPGRSRSRDSSGPCLYRAPDGNKCFVGCLLTDEEAEGLDRPRNALTVYGIAKIDRMPERLSPHLALLDDLQKIHDMYEPSQWPAELAYAATNYGLTIPPTTAGA